MAVTDARTQFEMQPAQIDGAFERNSDQYVHHCLTWSTRAKPFLIQARSIGTMHNTTMFVFYITSLKQQTIILATQFCKA